MTQIYARLKPYNPQQGQPHKKVCIAPINMTFQAGKFVRLPGSPATVQKLCEYLEQQYPEDDLSRPCMYQMVAEAEMRRIQVHEAREAEMTKQAALLGISVDEMRRNQRAQRAQGGNSWEIADRAERLETRKPTELEQIAAEIQGGKSATPLDEIGEELGDAVVAGAVASSASEMWTDLQGELVAEAEGSKANKAATPASSDSIANEEAEEMAVDFEVRMVDAPGQETPEQVQELLSGSAPKNDRPRARKR